MAIANSIGYTSRCNIERERELEAQADAFLANNGYRDDFIERPFVTIGLSVDEWATLSWRGWGKETVREAFWLAQLSNEEGRAFTKVFLGQISPEKLTHKSGFGNRSATGIEKLARRAAEKLCEALEKTGGIPVAPDVLLCWLEDVFGRPIYHAPSHVKTIFTDKRRKKIEWE